MKISVGSRNPAKRKAVENVINKIWKEADIVSVEVSSGVREQPLSDAEAIEGATNRARESLEKTDADLGIGLEGCTVDTEYGMFVSGWVVVIDREGEIGIGGGGRLLLPERIASEVRMGRELGPVMDELTGNRNVKQKQGAVGILTNNLVPRVDAFERTVVYALAKFMNPHYYRDSTDPDFNSRRS